MNKLRDEKGFTLIEVLVSLVIVTIVLTTFFAFFSQSMMFSTKNEEQIVTMNLARQTLSLIQGKEVLLSEGNYPDPNAFPTGLFVESDGTFLNDSNYKLVIDVTPDDDLHLLLIHLQIFNTNDQQLMIETYGYVEGF